MKSDLRLAAPIVLACLAPRAALAQASASAAAPAAPIAAPDPQVVPTPGTPPAAAPAVEVKRPWYEGVDIGAFVDTYYSLNYRMPRPNSGTNLYHPFNQNGGFGLAWAGLDVAYAPDPVGGTMQLRFGPAVPNLALNDAIVPGGILNVQQAFASWRPLERLTLILGKFDAMHGAEVPQSQLNINYTRGALFNQGQPFFHTGARGDVQLSDVFVLKLMLVNGWNNTVDNNRGKSFGGSLVVTPSEQLSVALGYLGGPEQADTLPVVDPSTRVSTPTDVPGANGRFRHLGDVVVDWKPTPSVRLVANGTFVTEAVIDATTGATRNAIWGGLALMGRYAWSSVFATALRGEVVHDADGLITLPNTGKMTLYTGTLTLEAAVSRYLLVRLDNRADVADAAVFPSGLTGLEKTQFTSTLGVVAKTK